MQLLFRPEHRTAASLPTAGGQIEAQCKWCRPCVSSKLTAWWSAWTRSRGACTPGAAKHVMQRPQQPVGLSAHKSLSFWEDLLEHSHACPLFAPANVAACSSEEAPEVRGCESASATSAGTSLCPPPQREVMNAQSCNDCRAIRNDWTAYYLPAKP